jgi:membrane-bound lytic murein transglycosylase D
MFSLTAIEAIKRDVMTGLCIYRFCFILIVVCGVNTSYSQINDSLHLDKIGFKSLFANDSFNPNKPYLSQLSPKAVPFVEAYIRKQGKELTSMKEWGRPYFALYDQILTEYGVPKEMKYLSVIESHLRSGLVSWAGAVGPWQLMDYEAKRFGLKLSPIDERTDYTKSTQVAAKLLKELYDQFGDWLLVVAAYNGGAGRVRQAIRKSGSRDFWDLQYFLKEETRTHVKKFIGTHYLFEGSGGLTTMTKQEASDFKANASNKIEQLLTDQELATTTTTSISGRYNSKILIKFLEMEIAQFTKWNPDFDRKLAVGERYQLRLTKDKLAIFEARKNDILAESIRMLLEGH